MEGISVNLFCLKSLCEVNVECCVNDRTAVRRDACQLLEVV